VVVTIHAVRGDAAEVAPCLMQVASTDAHLVFEMIGALAVTMTDVPTDHGTTETTSDHVDRAAAAHENHTSVAGNHVSHLAAHHPKIATAVQLEMMTANTQRHARHLNHAGSAGATALGLAAQTALTGTYPLAQQTQAKATVQSTAEITTLTGDPTTAASRAETTAATASPKTGATANVTIVGDVAVTTAHATTIAGTVDDQINPADSRTRIATSPATQVTTSDLATTARSVSGVVVVIVTATATAIVIPDGARGVAPGVVIAVGGGDDYVCRDVIVDLHNL
jgi:hypothetical protein